MSASREKKKRFEERADGTEKRQVRAKTDYSAKKRKKLITTVAAVVVVLLLVVAVVFNSNLFYTGVSAVKVGDTKYTAADFNYEYFNTFYNTYSSIEDAYGSYASMLLDPKKPLDEQNYSETQTWQDYFEDQAFTQLQQMTMLNDLAKAEGWQLDNAQVQEIEANIDAVKTAAVSNGYADYRAYIRALYGKGITEPRLRELLRQSFNATYYSQYLIDKWMNAYTEDELAEYYNGVRNDYDLVSYMSYFVDGSVPEDSELDADTALSQARDIANEIASAGDQATFADAVYQYAPEDQKADYADADACLTRLASPGMISDAAWKTWLTDPQRQSGDTTVLAGQNGFTVLLFLERDGNEYKTANFRGITITVANDEETGEITDATRAAAEATVDIIMESFNEDPTEQRFADLANMYDMSGQQLDGGLYADIAKGQTSIREMEDFLFDENTKVGDIDTFYADGVYYVVYALERGEQYNLLLAKNLKASDQYNSLIEEARANYPVDTKFAFRFTK